MTTIGPLSLTINLPVSAAQMNQGKSSIADAEPSATPGTGVEVNLSSEGRTAASSASRDADIERSGLPEGVQKLLKAIRELQRKIEEIQQQIQQVIADQSLSDNERQTKVAALQTALGAVQQQISSSSSDLAVMMNQLKLDEGSKTLARSLMTVKG
ncbi:chemotaxis protein [Pseudomonas triticifolii]|uniref:Chemotaxis protein n=1 Tax=Pseudomonas triticifolii TaxID=2762592 RepID=A0ABR7BE45_9PSED|nr:chemotaxis protein [Pseudomonas triticifolii]MBC3955429.1 chemotaxis protein [Pseudomonas triticifolii]